MLILLSVLIFSVYIYLIS